MKREEAKEMLPIIQEFVEGKKIEYSNDGEDRIETETPTWDTDYVSRIKSEPEYRPFKTAEECWNEMHKHPDFGWIKDDDVYRPIIKIDKEKIYYLEYGFKRTGITYSSFKESLELKFTDGTPFGVKEE